MTSEDFLEQYNELSSTDIELLSKKMSSLCVSKKEIVQEEGKRDNYIYLVEKGLIRSYITREAKDLTITISSEGEVPFSSPSLTLIGSANFTLQALEDSVLWKIWRKDIEEALYQSITLASWGRHITEKWLKYNTDYYLEMYWLNKKEQYKYLLSNYPNLVRRLSVSDIASWLNVTPQSLSRIRADLD